MMEMLSRLIRWLSNNWGKIVLCFSSTLTFIFLLFPFNDLTDLLSSQISKATHNQIFLQTEGLDVSLLPSPGINLERVLLETPSTPSLRVQNLAINPSLSSLLYGFPYGNVLAEGIMNGNIKITTSKGAASANGQSRQKVYLKAEKLNLKDLRDLARLPILMKGNLNLETQALADLSFQEQPEMEFNLSIQQFEIPTANVNTPMGPLTFPDLKMKSVQLKGKLSAGSLQIENGTLGSSEDELFGTIQGQMKVQIQNQNGRITPLFQSYNLILDLNAKKSFQDKAALFLTFIDQYKRPTAEGGQYKFKLATDNLSLPPTFSAVQ